MVDTRSNRGPLSVGGISVDCRWYIDWLSYEMLCYRVFFKASRVLETYSTEVLQTLQSDNVAILKKVAEK